MQLIEEGFWLVNFNASLLHFLFEDALFANDFIHLGNRLASSFEVDPLQIGIGCYAGFFLFESHARFYRVFSDAVRSIILQI